MKVAIYGTGNRAEYFLETCKTKNVIPEIVYFVETDKSRDVFHGKKVIAVKEIQYSEFDYLIIASDLYYGEMIAQLSGMGHEYEKNADKVVKYDHFFPEDIMWNEISTIMPYKSCKVCDDIVYISSSEDEVIPKCMYETGRNYAETVINAFFELSEKYYDGYRRKKQGYFLDIGANIGTTSIYVKKKINDKLHIVGFEPGKLNYDLFRVNCILNQVEDIRVEKLGLSNLNGTSNYLYNVTNSGGSWIVEDAKGKNISTVNLTRLDDYLHRNNIPPEDIDYMWMDTEGYESEIIEGAMETLAKKKIPLLQEFNPYTYAGRNTLDTYCCNIGNVYDYFLDVNEYVAGKEKIMETSLIHDFAAGLIKDKNKSTDIFLF